MTVYSWFHRTIATAEHYQADQRKSASREYIFPSPWLPPDREYLGTVNEQEPIVTSADENTAGKQTLSLAKKSEPKAFEKRISQSPYNIVIGAFFFYVSS